MLILLSILSAGLTIGSFIMGFFYLKHYRELVEARQKLHSKDLQLETEKEKLVVLKNEMQSTFQLAAQDALKGSNQEFLKMAELTLGKYQQQASHSLEQKNTEMRQLVDPLKESLSNLQKEVSLIERERQKAYLLVENEIKKVVENNATLGKETRALKNALTKPNVRGQWGEMQLKRCIELAGMSEYTDVTFQDHTDIGDKVLIPDMTVKMPGDRLVIVDAKTPLDSFLLSHEADNEEKRQGELLRHGKQVREHVVKLSRKSYGELFKNSADFTVMFLPNESFLYAALETQKDLVEFALEKKILIATPPTFVGLLKVIRFGWNEDKLNKNAEEISKIGQELHKRVGDFLDSYLDIGKSLNTAQERYQTGLKRLNSRVLPQAKKMESLGAKSHKEIPTLDH